MIKNSLVCGLKGTKWETLTRCNQLYITIGKTIHAHLVKADRPPELGEGLWPSGCLGDGQAAHCPSLHHQFKVRFCCCYSLLVSCQARPQGLYCHHQASAGHEANTQRVLPVLGVGRRQDCTLFLHTQVIFLHVMSSLLTQSSWKS